ncbi:MAG: hypothetical protein E7214_14645 [Clostridium sp.]|nr:hypothetical protein [Clostridium sp.]
MKKLLAIVLILSMSIVLPSCSKNNSTNKSKNQISMYVGGTMFSSSLDPIKGAMSYGYSFTNCALIKVNSESKYVGDLATDWSITDDSLCYTFNLRKNVKFQDRCPYRKKACSEKINMRVVKGGEVRCIHAD